MRLLYINSRLVDIDEQTSIGIDFQVYDIKEPSRRKVNTSNNFSIPKTARNLAIFGHPDNPQSTSDIIYDLMSCDYWIDNYHLISSATVRIEDIGDRISLYTVAKNDIWENLKLLTWRQFEIEYIDWLENVKGTTIGCNLADFATFMSSLANSTEDLILPFYMGNFYGVAGAETTTKIQFSKYYIAAFDERAEKGGHLCVFSKSVFEFLEYKYGVNFCTQEVALNGNIWDDTYAPYVYTPIRDLLMTFTYDISGDFETFKIGVDNGYYSSKFTPFTDLTDKGGKTMHDYVKSFLQKFNAIVDTITLSDGSIAIRISRFDDIKTLAPVIDFSGMIQSVSGYKPYVSGFGQNNYIKVGSIFPEGSPLLGQRNITSLNKNTPSTVELFSIDEYYPSFFDITGGIVPNLSVKESFTTFQFFVSSALSTDTIAVIITGDYSSIQANIRLYKASLYSLAGEYTFLEEIMQKPKVYTIKKWLSLRDIFNLDFFAQYYVKELNGSCYINKISGFNPQKSNEPTTVELIRISDKTPTPNFGETDYFTDNDEEFTDGLGNFFY